ERVVHARRLDDRARAMAAAGVVEHEAAIAFDLRPSLVNQPEERPRAILAIGGTRTGAILERRGGHAGLRRGPRHLPSLRWIVVTIGEDDAVDLEHESIRRRIEIAQCQREADLRLDPRRKEEIADVLRHLEPVQRGLWQVDAARTGRPWRARR